MGDARVTLLFTLALVAGALTAAFHLLVVGALFSALWAWRVPPLAYTAVAIAPLAGGVLVLHRRTAGAGLPILLLGGAGFLVNAALDHSGGWTGTAALVVAQVLAALHPAGRGLVGVRRPPALPGGRTAARGFGAAALGGLAVSAAILTAVLTNRSPNAAVPPGTDPTAARYLARALAIARANSLWRDTVTWDAVRDSAYRRLGGSPGLRGAHDAVGYVLERLGDGHSGLDPLGRAPTAPPRLTRFAEQSRLPVSRDLAPGIAYVEVPWYITGITDGAAWSRTLRDGLRARDRAAPCGWVLDLRRNAGGDMWPMLDGVAPLLPEGVAGGVAMPRRRSPAPWWIVGGRAYSTVPIAAGLDWVRGRRQLAHGDAPVAVLLGRQTASAGEAVAIAFAGRRFTRSFGDTTAGLSSANASWTMPDGARLAITVGVDVDRLGRRYEHGVVPDEPVTQRGGPGDPVIERAVGWLRGAGLDASRTPNGVNCTAGAWHGRPSW